MKDLFQFALELGGALSSVPEGSQITVYNYASKDSNTKRIPLLKAQAYNKVLDYEVLDVIPSQGKIQIIFKEKK
jgi:hypothetical protein|tara:strand:+ start:599 stop:820 length:222 start_codon:yes stop_codon:yes gene_type:complete